MCLFRHRPLDSRSRKIFAAGNLCLAIGLSLPHFAENFSIHHPALYDGLRFLLMLLAINLLFWVARQERMHRFD